MATAKPGGQTADLLRPRGAGDRGSLPVVPEARLAHLASFPERNPNPVVEVALDGTVRYANPAALGLFPDLAERGAAHPWLADWSETVGPFREGRALVLVREVRVGGCSFEQTLHFMSPDDTVRIYAHDCTARREAEDALRGMNALLESRTRERTAELTEANRALRAEVAVRQAAEAGADAERERLHEVLEALPAYVILLAADYRVRFANRVFRERFGEAGNRQCFEFLFGRTEPCENCESYTPLSTGRPHRWEWTGPDGHDYDIRDIPFVGRDGSTMVLEMGVDITERRKAEAALRELNQTLERRVAERTAALAESADRFRVLAEGMPHVVWLCDAQGHCLYQNRVWSEYVGCEPGTTLGELWIEYHHPADREQLLAAWRECIASNGTRGFGVEARIRRHDGAYRWFRIRGAPVRDASGAVIHWAGTATDIDDERSAQAEALRHMADLRAANESLTRFNRVAVDRELRMIELKREVNGLCARLGLPARYALGFDKAATGP